MTLKRESFQYCVFIKSMDLFFCHLLMLAVLVSMLIVFDAPVNAYYIRFNHGNESKLSTDSAVVGRIKRVPCEVVLYYDVVCHGRCPPYEKEWNSNREHMNCLDGLVYHCAKDNTTGKYVEACADPIRCERGKEPRLVFPEGHTKTAFVTCQYCANEEFYNPSEYKLSSTYYMCPKGKRPCDANKGQIPCDVVEGIERHWKTHKCRCDVKQGYIQDFSDHQTDTLCEDTSNLRCIPFQCDPTSNGTAQELLKNYTCVPVCDEGFQRNDTSDLCTPIPRKASSTVPNKFTVFENPRAVIKTTQMLNPTINNVTIETTIVSTSDVKETTPTASIASTNTNFLVVILCVVLGVVVIPMGIAFIITICYYKRKLSNKEDKQNNQHTENDTPFLDKEDKQNNQHTQDQNDTPFLDQGEDQHAKFEVKQDGYTDHTNANDTLTGLISDSEINTPKDVGVQHPEETSNYSDSNIEDPQLKKNIKASANVISLNKSSFPKTHFGNAEYISSLPLDAGKNLTEENRSKTFVPPVQNNITVNIHLDKNGQILQTSTSDTVRKGGNEDGGNIPHTVTEMNAEKDEHKLGNSSPIPEELFNQKMEEN